MNFDELSKIIISYLPTLLSALMTLVVVPYITGQMKNISIKSEIKNFTSILDSVSLKDAETLKVTQALEHKFEALSEKYETLLKTNDELTSRLAESSKILAETKAIQDRFIQEEVKTRAILRGVHEDKEIKKTEIIDESDNL